MSERRSVSRRRRALFLFLAGLCAFSPEALSAARFPEQVKRSFTFDGEAGARIVMLAGAGTGPRTLPIMSRGEPAAVTISRDSGGRAIIEGVWSDAETGSAAKVPQFFVLTGPLGETELRTSGWLGFFQAIDTPLGTICSVAEKSASTEIVDGTQRIFQIRAYCGREGTVFLSIGIDERAPAVRERRMAEFRECLKEVEEKGLDSGC